MTSPNEPVTMLLAADVGGLRLPSGRILGRRVSDMLGRVDLTLFTEPPDLHLTLEFAFVDLPHEQLRRAATELAETVLVRLAYETDIAIGPARIVRDNLESFVVRVRPPSPQTITREPGLITVAVSDGFRASFGAPRSIRLERVMIVGEGGQEALSSRLQDQSEPGIYHRMYRTVMQSKDSVARFLLLFMLLEMICVPDPAEGRPQAKVDAWIRRTEPGVENRSAVVHGGERTETIYAWLRNALVHHSGRGGDLSKIRGEVSRSLEAFMRLVKIAVEQAGDPEPLAN